MIFRGPCYIYFAPTTDYLSLPLLTLLSFTVQMTNNCGSGSPVFLYEANGTPQGPTTIGGQLLGGIAWIDGFSGADCESSGVNCGAVEFTLRNDDPYQNAADFTLEAQSENGNHQLYVPALTFASENFG